MPDLLNLLDWDTQHFGFPVAKIVAAELDNQRLAATLASARQQGIRLVYWTTPPTCSVSATLLDEYGGRLVDRKAIYACESAALVRFDLGQRGAGVSITDYPPGPVTPRLLELAVEAGVYSRFHVDPRIPHDRFVSLYETWMRRSTLREGADVVLIAEIPGECDAPVGFVTGRASEWAHGLMAVDERFRGRGIAWRLLDTLHRRLFDLGVPIQHIITQLDNQPARTLYERFGYRLESVEHVFHFWP